MAENPIFAVPVYTRAIHDGVLSTLKSRKRKRNHTELQKLQDVSEDTDASQPSSGLPIEYTAVLTPIERTQRRLAGQALDKDLPPPPFPHSVPGVFETPSGENVADSINHVMLRRSTNAPVSLRRQRLAAMTAILHQSMIKADYDRAQRAMGLLLRSQDGGQPFDIRREGFWGIGAELILRNKSSDRGVFVSRTTMSREFELVRKYYETLIVQYPQHKSWPSAINTIDFVIALFGLWIYAVQKAKHESLEDGGSDDASTMVEFEEAILHWELTQAQQVISALDKQMADTLLRDQRELVRLRAMVALWTGDVCDRIVEVQQERCQLVQCEAEDNSAADVVTTEMQAQLTAQAASAFQLARDLLTKIDHSHAAPG